MSFQISCASALPEINDQKMKYVFSPKNELCINLQSYTSAPPFRYYFQMLASTDVMSYGFLSLMLQFGWKMVSIITHNDAVYITVSLISLDISITTTEALVTGDGPLEERVGETRH